MDTLIDSNVLIRAHDAYAEPYAKAADLAIREYAHNGRGALSAQSLSEFAMYATLHFGMPERLLLEQIRRLRALFPVLPLTADVIEATVRLLRRHSHLSLYEAQVRAMASENGLSRILSEMRANRWRHDGIEYQHLLRHAYVGGWTALTQGTTSHHDSRQHRR